MLFSMEKYHVLNIRDNLIYITIYLGKKAEKCLNNDLKRLMIANQHVTTDAFPALNIIDKKQQHKLIRVLINVR